MLSEAARTLPHRPRLTVYATDIDQHAVSVARTGNYPSAIANDISPSVLAQYFYKDGNRYRLVKSLRDTVIFAAHNILHDPPFSRLDVVSCRNLLIYLDRRAQTRVLEIFHFALRPGGFLFLGGAESAEGAPELFEPVDKHRKIYRALPAAAAGGPPIFSIAPVPMGSAGPFFALTGHARSIDLGLQDQTRVLGLFGPPVIVMRSDGEIVYRSGVVRAVVCYNDHEGFFVTQKWM